MLPQSPPAPGTVPRKQSQRASSSLERQKPPFAPSLDRASHSASGLSDANADANADVNASQPNGDVELQRSFSGLSLESSGGGVWRVQAVIDCVVRSDWFNNGIIVLIVANSLILACYDPSKSAQSMRNAWIDSCDIFFQAMFTLEAALRMAHLGCRGYFKDALNVCDFVLVVLGFAEYVDGVDAAFTKVFRAFRVLRSFRLLKHIPGMVILLEIISHSSAQLLTVLWLASFIVFAFGILGVELFKDVPLDTEQFSSVIGFQNILQSFCTLFVVLGREGWVEVADWIEHTMPNSGVYFVILTAFGSVLVLNLIVTVLVLNYKNNRHHALHLRSNKLYTEVAAIDAKAAERKLLQDGYKAEVSAIHLMRLFEHKHGQTNVLSLQEYLKLRKRYGAQYRRWRKENKVDLHRYGPTAPTRDESQAENGEPPVADSSQAQATQFPFKLEVVAALFIIVFAIANALPYFLQPLETAQNVRIISIVCAAFFCVELVLKIAWAGGIVAAVRSSSWTKIADGLLILVACPLLFAGVFQSLLVFRIPRVLSLRDRYITTIASEQSSVRELAPQADQSTLAERIWAKVSRALRMIWWRVKEGLLAQRFEMLKGSLLQVAPFFLILCLFMHIFAVTGLYLFGETFTTSADLSTAALGYGSYLRAFVTTFQVLTGEGWNTLMYEAVNAFGAWSVLYYILLLTVGNFVFLNLLLAIFIDAYINGKPEESPPDQTPAQSDLVSLQVEALKAQMQKRDSVRTQSSSARPLTPPLTRMRPISPAGASPTLAAFRRKAFEIMCWMHQHFALDVFGFVVTLVYALGFPFSTPLGHTCLVLMYMEGIARLAIGDIDELYLADAIAVVLASAHWWFTATGVTLSLRSVVVVRLFRWDPHVRGMIRSFGKSLPGCLVLCATAFVLFSAFAVVSVERYAGKFMRCEGLANNKTCFDFANNSNAAQYDLAPCTAQDNCLDAKERFEWRNPKDDSGAEVMNFDSYGAAMRAVFEMATLEAWNEAMLRGTQVTLVGQLPQDGASEYDALFFMVVVCVGHLLILQLFIAVMIETFLFEEMSHKGSDVLSASQLSWVENQVQTIFQQPRRELPAGEEEHGGLRRKCFRIVDSRRFERIVCTAVLIDSLLMATQYHDEPEWKRQALAASQAVFAALYLLEACMKIIAYGISYFRSARNLFDLAIVVLALLSTVSFYTTQFIPNLTSLRVLRIAWVFPSLRAFLQLLARALPAMLRVFRVFLMLMYVYVFAGMSLCGQSGLFGSIPSASRTLYIVAIGDGWTEVAKQLEEECVGNESAARFLVISYVFCVTFVVMNLLIAVMLQVFEQEFLRNSLDQLSLAKYRREWFKFMRRQGSFRRPQGQTERKALQSEKKKPANPMQTQRSSSFRRHTGSSQQRTESSTTSGENGNHPAGKAAEAMGNEKHVKEKPELERSGALQERNGSSAAEGGVRKKLQKKLGSEVWLKSAKGSYMSAAVFPEFLMKLKPPLGLVDFTAGVYTQRDLLKLVHLARIPITRGNLMNFNSVLFALSEFRYRMNTGEEIPANLREVALRLHLSGSNREKFETMLAEANPRYRLSHYMAAEVIQTFFRDYRKQMPQEAKVMRNVMGIFGWNQSRSALNGRSRTASVPSDHGSSEEAQQSEESILNGEKKASDST